MITIRCSLLPIIVRCQGMLQRGWTAINPISAVADAGTDVHRRIVTHVRDGTRPDEGDPDNYLYNRLNQVADKFGIYLEGFRMETEVKGTLTLGEVQLVGHPDYWNMSMGDPTCRLVDIKSGWRGGEGGAEDVISLKHAEQLIGYAFCIMAQVPELRYVNAAIIPRVGPIQYETWSREHVMGWAVDLRALLTEWDGQFKPGDHCQYCPRRFDCSGLRQMERASVGFITDEGRLHDLTDPATQADLWDRARIVGTCVDRLQNEIRKHLPIMTKEQAKSAACPIWLEPTTKRVIYPVEAWTVLAREIGDEGLAECVTIGLAKLESSIKARAERGEKERFFTAIMKELADRGALQFVPGANRVVINKEEK